MTESIQQPPTTPFPGMDPYLEHPVLWEGFHGPFVAELRSKLNETLPTRYVASVEERVFIEIPEYQRMPDVWVKKAAAAIERQSSTAVAAAVDTDSPVVVEVSQIEIKERYLEILDRYEEMRVVTVIEVVSPSNKRPGDGRDAYVVKQQSTLASETHLVEIDLLRKGRHVVAVPETMLPHQRPFDYLISINRWPARRRFELYPVRLHDRLPKIGVPLVEPDPDAAVDLQAVLEKVYKDARYMLRVRYDDPCDPPLSPEDQKWAEECWAAYRQVRTDLFPAT